MKARFDHAVRWYGRQSRPRRTTLRAIPITVVTYATALVGGAVAESLQIEGFWQFLFVTGAIIGLVGVVVIAMQVLFAAAEEIQAEGDRQQAVLNSAYSFADRWMLQELKMLTAIGAGARTPVVLAPADPQTAIERLIQSAYDALTAQYGQAPRLDERIDFKVTFMTRSYIDDQITIAAWANRDGRKPTSMQHRATEPQTYARTVTADVYRAQRPEMCIIENTADPQSNYAELYAGQKQRIKSSVVYPVLSSEYGLLGTMVMHCDRPDFFVEGARKFWRDFCEVFAKRIALEKLLLDEALRATGTEELGAQHWPEPPF